MGKSDLTSSSDRGGRPSTITLFWTTAWGNGRDESDGRRAQVTLFKGKTNPQAKRQADRNSKSKSALDQLRYDKRCPVFARRQGVRLTIAGEGFCRWVEFQTALQLVRRVRQVSEARTEVGRLHRSVEYRRVTCADSGDEVVKVRLVGVAATALRARFGLLAEVSFKLVVSRDYHVALCCLLYTSPSPRDS